MNADGSNPVNLTNTPEIDELYPKASPDGKKICFCADEGKGDEKVRNLYVMDLDGGKRMKIADNSREPCWNGDGTKVAFLRGEFDKFTFSDFATKGIFIYDLATGQTRQHPHLDAGERRRAGARVRGLRGGVGWLERDRAVCHREPVPTLRAGR